MDSTIVTAIQTNALALITMGGTVNPYVGLAIALVLGLALAYFAYQAAQQAWQTEKNVAGTALTGTAQDQKADTDVNNQGDGFLK